MSTTLQADAPLAVPMETTRDPSYQICTRCVMDTTDPDIVFDDDGHCNHCGAYFNNARRDIVRGSEGEAQLQRIVDKVKAHNRHREYDCIIGVSGGVDSTMVAYHVRRLGLRAIALHLDNGWNSELAVDNIHRTLSKLDIDLQTHVVDWEEFKDLQLSFLKASVVNCEIPTDHAINSLLINTAVKTGIRYVFSGGNQATEGIMPRTWTYSNVDLCHIRAIHRRFGSVRLKTLPRISLFGLFHALCIRRVKLIPLLNYTDYNKTEAKELLQRELGWRDYGGKHYESIYTRFFQGHILPQKFNIDKRRCHLSMLVCGGEITRDEALRELQKDPYGSLNLDEEMEFVIKKLGLTQQQFDEIMAAAPKPHVAYPSSLYRLRKVRSLIQRIRSFARVT